MLVIILATISTNTAANIVSPTNVFQNVAPKLINEDRGVIITGLIGLALMSWELLKKLGWLETDVSVESLYSNWLLGYSSLLGPIAGIMVVDYFLVKNQEYNLIALYKDGAGYPAWNQPDILSFLEGESPKAAPSAFSAPRWRRSKCRRRSRSARQARHRRGNRCICSSAWRCRR